MRTVSSASLQRRSAPQLDGEKPSRGVLRLKCIAESTGPLPQSQDTPAALKRHRSKLIDHEKAGNRGGIIKTIADGALIEFGSAVDVVRTGRDRRHHHVPVTP
jgi:hypothetical protein